MSNLYYATYSFSLVGNYNYTWYAYGNGVTNRLNASATYTYTVLSIPSTNNNGGTSTSSGGGIPIYYPRESDLKKGYSKQLYKNWKISFKHNEELHQLNLNSFDKENKTATITISSDPQTKTLSIGEIWKVNLNNDPYYDVFVRLDGVTATRADIFIKEINESIIESSYVAEDGSSNGDAEPKDIIKEDVEYINYWIYAGIVIVILAVIIFIYSFFIRKKIKKRG